jgi:outer membrane murein-binding lipoprotein Lpp
MRKLLLGIALLVVAGILAGCTDQTNTDQTIEINELKNQNKQLSFENEALQNTVEEHREALEATNNTNEESPQESTSNMNNDYSLILAKDIEKYPQALYKKTTLDIDEDGEDEIIELYVNAYKMENGVFAWDDGQTWLLVVKDGEKTYPLFEDFVQMGSIDFSTTTLDGKPGIVMLMTWHFDRTVQKFTYDHDAKGFEKDTFYKKENLLQQYNQPASYAFFEDAYELVEQAFTDKVVTALKASENELQDRQDRLAIFDPISADLRNAQRLFVTARELNPELHVSLDSPLDLLNQMVISPPTSAQMNQLRYIHDVFIENESDDLIIEENQIHPDIKENLERVDIILNGKK